MEPDEEAQLITELHNTSWENMRRRRLQFDLGEEQLREILDLPEHFHFAGAEFDFRRQAFVIQVVSPYLPQVPQGAEAPRALAEQRVVTCDVGQDGDVHKHIQVDYTWST